MVQKRRLSPKLVEAQYTRLVEVQDTFWREIFPRFMEPLNGFFEEPEAAAARLISRYLGAPQSLAQELTSTPETFGTVVGEPDPKRSEMLAAAILSDTAEVTLGRCAEAFTEVRAASAELDKMRLMHPRLFHELQRRRALRNQNKLAPPSPPAASVKHYIGLSRYFGVKTTVKNSTSRST
jgi:hypothetical protein